MNESCFNLQILRFVASAKLKRVTWREKRPYLFVNSLHFVPNENSATVTYFPYHFFDSTNIQVDDTIFVLQFSLRSQNSISLSDLYSTIIAYFLLLFSLLIFVRLEQFQPLVILEVQILMLIIWSIFQIGEISNQHRYFFTCNILIERSMELLIRIR